MGIARRPDLRRRVDVGDRRDLRVHPVTAETDDGLTWDGLALVPRAGDPERRRLAVVVVHGSVGNYISGVPRWVSHGLANAGFTVLSVNTRMANYGVFFGTGLLQDAPLDLDAWRGLVERMGHRRIVLLGYSLGATMVTCYQALRRPESVAGICTLAHPLSLPASLRRRWERFGADPDYATVAARARAVVDGGPEDDEIFIVRRAAGSTDAPGDAEIWTYRTWWYSRGPEADHAVSAAVVGQVGVPIALIQAADDPIVPPGDGPELASLARAGASPDVRLEWVDGADHAFRGREPVALERCVAWLDEVMLGRVPEGPRGPGV